MQIKRDLSPANEVPRLARQLQSSWMAKAKVSLTANTTPWVWHGYRERVSLKRLETWEMQLWVRRFLGTVENRTG